MGKSFYNELGGLGGIVIGPKGPNHIYKHNTRARVTPAHTHTHVREA